MNRYARMTQSLPIPEASLKALVDACPDIQAEDYTLTVFGLCSKCLAKETNGEG